MLKSAIVRTVDTCTRHPWSVIILALVLTVGSAFYAARHFEITTDVEQLISKDLPWRRRQAEFYQAFPQRDIIAVVDAPVPELVARATDELSRSLMQRQEFIRGVRQPGSGEFFARNGLLFSLKQPLTRKIHLWPSRCSWWWGVSHGPAEKIGMPRSAVRVELACT